MEQHEESQGHLSAPGGQVPSALTVDAPLNTPGPQIGCPECAWGKVAGCWRCGSRGIVREFGHKEDLSGWLRVLVTVERSRSRWAVVQTAYTTRAQQWGGTRIPAGSLHSRVVTARGLPTKASAITKATGSAA